MIITTIGPSHIRLVADTNNTPEPESVTIAGTIQSKLGCGGDWQPDGAQTFLAYHADADLWTAEFVLPAGKYEYKVALNASWGENYGLNAKRDGPNIPLNLARARTVRFIYDHKTHWVSDNVNSILATAPGSYESKIGCRGDWNPDCLVSWLQDPNGTGIYAFVTEKIPAGSYEAKVALNLSMDENYGQDGQKNGANIAFTVPADNVPMVFVYDPRTHLLTVAPGARGDLSLAQAQWITRDTIAWKIDKPAPDYEYRLYFDPAGAMKLDSNGISGGQAITLIYDPAGLTADQLEQWPHLTDYSALKIGAGEAAKMPAILRGQIAVAVSDSKGTPLDATSVQIAGAVDDLYFYDGPLGVTFQGNIPTLRVWAPTAKRVGLRLFDDTRLATSPRWVEMTGDPATGVWSVTGDASWKGKYYLYEVQVYVRTANQVRLNLVTDPYSVSLSADSRLSQIVDLDDPDLMPDGWKDLQKPDLKAPTDIVIYELHLRDFSILDQTVPENERGTYLAFTQLNSNGMQHLKALADAGLTHVYLLPVFDFATLEEISSKRIEPDLSMLTGLPPNSDRQQAILADTRATDGFNWGYDPYHYTTPEGSYATDPDGTARIVEFRKMVQALNRIGLRVVMDVVYNHTSESGESQKSVLDKIVPGYYYRLTADGSVETSTCCQNTASEHRMMEKLMVDSVVTWATCYKVDGFRFDLMGHHTLSNMVRVRDSLHALTPARDGVDGPAIYMYGEGWNFGEVADNQRGVNATQVNLAGTGIGVFNDRLRDAVRGGAPFNPVQDQGFITGLALQPNGASKDTFDHQKALLLKYTDWVRIGLAGNLKDYRLVDASGRTAAGSQIDYNGAPAGYTALPQENVVYISAHDNETLFDAIQLKAAADATIADRVRMTWLGNSLVMFSQGIPFFHAGDEILRSKSGDRNSYDSGDWFNRLDFTYATNNWGVGLPPQGENGANWPLLTRLLGNPKLVVQKADITGSLAYFEDLLKIRRGSPLFRLTTADLVSADVKFYNTGPHQTPGLIMMAIADTTHLDPNYSLIVVVFNVAPNRQTYFDKAFANANLALHPILAASADKATASSTFSAGTFTVPARTTAVFVVVRD